MVAEAHQPVEERVDEANPGHLWAPVGACRAWEWGVGGGGRRSGAGEGVQPNLIALLV